MNGQEKAIQPRWQRIILLFIIGYEAAGCLLGGSLLVAAPDGKFMDMPVEMMHGFFRDFLVPGIILIGLGILSTCAFVFVVRRDRFDWLMASLALGSLFIWFVVEIIVLWELHWLHAVWGLPVMLGWVMNISLIALRHPTTTMRRTLLTCGILSSLWYMAINIFVPMQYEGYSMLSMAPSELSAIGAPTRVLWGLMVLLYPLLFAAFGWGVLQVSSSGQYDSQGSRYLRVVGNSIILYCVLNFYWPPMHVREVIAAGRGSLTDNLHIAWAVMTLLFMTLLMGFGAAASGRKFRVYTLTTFVVFLLCGVLTFMESPGLEAGLPTPLMGLWERINIAAFMVWVIVFAAGLLRSRSFAA